LFKSYNTWKTPKLSKKRFNELTGARDSWYYKEKFYKLKDSEGNSIQTYLRVLFYNHKAVNSIF